MVSAADLIKKYVELRDYKAVQEADLEARLAPYNEAMKTIEGMLQALLNKEAPDTDGSASIKTPHGTAYRKKVMSLKMADRDIFHKFVLANGATQFLTAAVSKEAVQEHMKENNGALPPGLDVAYIYNLNVRRS